MSMDLTCPYCGGEPDWRSARDEIDWADQDAGTITTYTRCTNPSCKGSQGFSMVFGFIVDSNVQFNSAEGRPVDHVRSYNVMRGRR